MSPPKFCMHNQLLVSLPLFLLVSLLFSVHAQASCHPDDTKILLLIKQHLGNPGSLASWDPNNPQRECCGDFFSGPWDGIKCDGQGHVSSLQIGPAEDINKTIPPFFDRLPSLTNLYLTNIPQLYGPIPSYIGKLTNLTSFMLFNTNVSGPIPKSLGRFTNLGELTLSRNQLIGPIPDSIGQLKGLSFLDLSENRLSGRIPPTLGNLINLDFLALNDNNLSGPIPDSIGQPLSVITHINLNNNNLSGRIPASLGLLRGLSFLSLSENQLSGSLPKSLGGTSIDRMRLGHNKLSGDASFLFANNTNLNELDLSYNRLKFNFSNVDYFPPQLFYISLSHNKIYGSLPKLFYRIFPSIHIDLSYNQLCGPIPNGRRLKKIDPSIFSHNKCLCGGPLPACK